MNNETANDIGHFWADFATLRIRIMESDEGLGWYLSFTIAGENHIDTKLLEYQSIQLYLNQKYYDSYIEAGDAGIKLAELMGLELYDEIIITRMLDEDESENDGDHENQILKLDDFVR